MRENVRMREQEFTRCQAILSERTAALMAKLRPAPEKTCEAAVQSQPGWALETAAACLGQ